MPQHTAAEREKNRRTRSERELEKLGEGTATSASNDPAPAAKAKPAPSERRSVGRDDSQTNFERLSADLRKNITAAEASGNTTLATKLRARLAALKEATSQAQ